MNTVKELTTQQLVEECVMADRFIALCTANGDRALAEVSERYKAAEGELAARFKDGWISSGVLPEVHAPR